MIIGIDEVGRGCWAGPLVAGAVLLAEDHGLKGVKDSKLLSKVARTRLNAEIQLMAAGWGLGWVTAAELDQWGLTEAVNQAMRRAMEALRATMTPNYTELIVDGNYNFLADWPRSRALIGADNLVPAVSAASIVAKVARDRYMAQAALRFPGYGFDQHVGYGTAQHRAALQQQGICELHRLSFRPVREFLQA